MAYDKNKLSVLFTEEQIQEKVKTLAEEIVQKYGRATIVLVGLLKGGAWLLTDLSRAIERRREGGLLCLDFMRLSSYPDDERQSSGQVRMEMDTQYSVQGKHVIIVDDVAETCQTVAEGKRYLLTKGPASVEICVLVNKDCPRLATVNLDYVGFDHVPGNLFLGGYGMNDNEGGLRGLPYIVVLPPKEEPGS